MTRGFIGRRRERDPRLPPGQYDARDEWPVLHAEATPNIPTERWTLTITGLVENAVTWNWDEIHALPPSRYEGDVHCVTTWSTLGMTFDGVSVDTLLAAATPLPGATHVMAESHTATPRTCGSPTSRAARRGSSGRPTATRSRRSTAGPPGCSCRTCTSGRARSTPCLRPDGTGEIEPTVEKLEDGEVSEYLHAVVLPGDSWRSAARSAASSPGTARHPLCSSAAGRGSCP